MRICKVLQFWQNSATGLTNRLYSIAVGFLAAFDLTMNWDEHLKQLAVEAQRHPPNTPQRQRSIAQLISSIYRSKKLFCPYRDQFPGLYEEIYAEAQQRLFLHICEKIDQYDSKFEVMQWANFLMKRRFFIEASRDLLPSPKGVERSQIKRMTLEVLEKQNPVEMQSQANISLSEAIIQCIQEDYDKVFQSTHIEKKPAANFQYIALRFLSGYSWKEVSEELDVKVVTLSSFYQRCLTKFASKFKEYLSS